MLTKYVQDQGGTYIYGDKIFEGLTHLQTLDM